MPHPITRSLRASLCGTALTLLITASPATSQSSPSDTVDAAERAAVIEEIGALLEAQYVFPDVAATCGESLLAALKSGEFDDLSDADAFATGLTKALQAVSHDKHMRVRARRPQQLQQEVTNPARAQAERQDRMRGRNFGFENMERHEGNVGYLDLRMFAGGSDAQATATAAMAFLAHSDAVIFDLRKNGGGSPEMVRFLCSYLFDEPTHLNSLYWRARDVTQEFWTEDVPGATMPDVPVFVLTSDRTFSAAEEFTYNLRTRERATVVGETTGGGANPGGTVPINERFDMFVPMGRAINPVTGINWEGTGVAPHVTVDADDALDTALELATKAAENYRTAREERRSANWDAFDAARSKALKLYERNEMSAAALALTNGLQAALDAELATEADINMLGYSYAEEQQTALAIAAFTFNVQAFPESANVYDSLAETYMNDGQIKRAIQNYEKSLELDPENNHAREMIAEMKAGG